MGLAGGIAQSFARVGGFLTSLPNKIILTIWRIIWPKQSRRRYRTALLAVFLLTVFALNVDYPKYWNKFADWANPKLDAIDMPEAVRKLDQWYILKKADDILNVPRFANVPFSLGLDLQGGLHLIYRADLSDVLPKDYEEAMQGLRDVIDRRVNLFGVREPQVFIQEAGGDRRLVVELAGVRDFNKAIEVIGQTPFLEFRELRPKDEQKRILREFFTTLEGGAEVKDEQLEKACDSPNPDLFVVFTQSGREDPCFMQITPASLTGKYLEKSGLQFDPNTNQPVVALELDSEGAAIFEEVTGRNVGKPLAIYLDGVLINWPRVQEKISGGNAQITGFNIEGAKTIARNLNAGALPVPITLISQQLIGASLGEKSLQKSISAGMIGFAAVIIFLIILYKLSGILAAIALMIYIVLLLALFKIVPVTLTLPGIAGLILSIGMAVDANVLVFERLREELSSRKESPGADFLFALSRAYERAWPAVRDGNISTLITCAILFLFSASFIKGFALTLGLGILMSMFCAMIVTRYLMRLLGEGRLGNKKWLWVR